MSFTRTHNVTCDLTDSDGNKGTFTGQVTTNGFGSEADAHALVKADFADKGITATNIRANGKS